MGHLIAAYIFGSVGRGEYDFKSDLDILAVVENGKGIVPAHSITSLIPPKFANLKPSISWYGGDRLREMFGNGELFAWHLSTENIPLFEAEPFLKSLGKPRPYRDAIKDISSFGKVLREIPDQLSLNDFNAIYEGGLLYVCLRNIAMSASWILCDAPDFSRHSPFRLKKVSRCPISVDEYEMAMDCRMAAQRGHDPPSSINANVVLNMYLRLVPWFDEILIELRHTVSHGQ